MAEPGLASGRFAEPEVHPASKTIEGRRLPYQAHATHELFTLDFPMLKTTSAPSYRYAHVLNSRL